MITPKLLIKKQSKLEVFNAILKTLGEHQSLSASDIENKTEIDSSVLVGAMKFLEKQNCVICSKIGNDFFL